MVGRCLVEGVVDMGRLDGVDAESPHSNPLLGSRIGHLHQYLAVEDLDDRTPHHRPE